MHRIDTSTATSDGLFTEGDPLVPTPATVVSADWLNSVQEELATIVTNAGLELQKADNTQVLTAILQIIARQSSELERLRLLKIGCPMYWRSTTLPEGFAWVNGDLVLFEDWPEFAAVYNAGGFSGMVLPYNADSATIAANLGKFRPNAANPTGLYLPSCGEQFFRAWTGGGDGLAGIYNAPGLPEIGGHFAPRVLVQGGLTNAGVALEHLSGVFHDGRPDTTETAPILATEGTYQVPAWNIKMLASRYNPIYSASDTVMPESVNLPVCLYLGLHT